MKHIFLIGFMGCGKTTISKALGRKLEVLVTDLDQKIVNEQGMPIADIFAQLGEEHFRNLETQAIKDLQKENRMVVACGGGAVLRTENVAAMKSMGTIILLTATPETTLKRCEKSKDRPILNGHMNVEFIAELMQKRSSGYEAAADITVATDDKSVEDIVNEIIEKL